uniref:Uncharacterized protein n=1 Tax=Anguilla anguilla TaxID=7936 RepID=A0A0E9XS83_ANGAN
MAEFLWVQEYWSVPSVMVVVLTCMCQAWPMRREMALNPFWPVPLTCPVMTSSAGLSSIRRKIGSP